MLPDERWLRLQQCMPGTELRLLHCKAQTQPFRRGLLDNVSLVADDHGSGGGREGIGRPEDMFQEWELARLVEHFWQGGLHPRAFAGSEDDDVNVGHDPSLAG